MAADGYDENGNEVWDVEEEEEEEEEDEEDEAFEEEEGAVEVKLFKYKFCFKQLAQMRPTVIVPILRKRLA